MSYFPTTSPCSSLKELYVLDLLLVVRRCLWCVSFSWLEMGTEAPLFLGDSWQMLTSQPFPLRATVVSVWVCACGDASLCWMHLGFVSTPSRLKQARQSGQRCLAQLAFSCFLCESCSSFVCFLAVFQNKRRRKCSPRVMALSGFEA